MHVHEEMRRDLVIIPIDGMLFKNGKTMKELKADNMGMSMKEFVGRKEGLKMREIMKVSEGVSVEEMIAMKNDVRWEK